MKKIHIPIKTVVINFVAFVLMTNPTLAQYTWTNNTPSPTPKPWETASNWDSPPPNPATNQVIFDYGYSSIGSFIVSLASDKELNEGILFKWGKTSGRLLTLDLGGNSLQLNGNEMLIEPTSTNDTGLVNFLTFSNGSVILDNGASLVFVNTEAAGTEVEGQGFVTRFDGTSIFDTKNASQIAIASTTVNRNHNAILDLSDATMKSGSVDQKLAVSDSLIIGTRENSGTTTQVTRGLLKMGVVSEISIGGDLILGRNNRRSNNLIDTRAYGTLEFSDKPEQGAVNLSIGGDLVVGVGAGVGTLTNTPELNVTIGSTNARGGDIKIGYKASGTGATTGNGDANGNFSTGDNGGSLSAWVTSLSIGQNGSAGTATGTMDFGSATLGVLDVSGDAIIGQGTNAVGTLILSGGTASSAKLIVGDSTSTNRSLVELNDTVWTVNDSLLLGAKGDITVTVNTVSGAGISLLSTNEADFSILTGGVMTVNFEAEGWGLRMMGEDHVGLFNSYLGSELIASGILGSQAEIYTDGGFTYFGVIPIPEPTAIWLMLFGPLLLLAQRRRKK